jgi:broad specificity phosphatase PhoE
VDLLLIRHAEPIRIENAEGPADPGLTERGHRQAAQLAAWLSEEHLDHVACSPLRRARETALPVAMAHGLEPEIIDELAEFDRTADSYIPIEELRVLKDERWHALIEGRWHEMSGGGDPPEEFVPRVFASVEAMVDRFEGQRIALVCHGGVINVYLAQVLSLPKLLWFEPAYASISRLAAARTGQRSIVSINERPGHPSEWVNLGIAR